MKGCALSLKGTRYDWHNQKQVPINTRQEKEGIGMIKYKCQSEKPRTLSGRKYDWRYQSQYQSKERQKGYILSSKGKGDIIGSIKTSANQKGKRRKMMPYPQKAGKICLGTNYKSRENYSKGSNKEPDK